MLTRLVEDAQAGTRSSVWVVVVGGGLTGDKGNAYHHLQIMRAAQPYAHRQTKDTKITQLEIAIPFQLENLVNYSTIAMTVTFLLRVMGLVELEMDSY